MLISVPRYRRLSTKLRKLWRHGNHDNCDWITDPSRVRNSTDYNTMKWHKKYRDRLEKLATHLEKGKLGHKKFNLEAYSLAPAGSPTCGSAGCALGECPTLFPRQWAFSNVYEFYSGGQYREPSLRAGVECPFLSAEQFFGLRQDEVSHLFFSDSQN